MIEKNNIEEVKTPKEKDIKISASSHQLLTKEAKNFKLSRKQYIESAIRFFALRGQSPGDFEKNMESHLVSEIKSLKKPLQLIIESLKILANTQDEENEEKEEIKQVMSLMVEEFMKLQKQGEQQASILKKIEAYLAKSTDAK